MELGYSTQLIGGGFQFQNPNAERCASASLRSVRTADRARRAAPAAAARASAPRPAAGAGVLCCNTNTLQTAVIGLRFGALCAWPTPLSLYEAVLKGPTTAPSCALAQSRRAPLNGPHGCGACSAPGGPRRLREGRLRQLCLLHSRDERSVGTCTGTTQPVDGQCYCGSPATGAGCLKFTSLGASAVAAAVWNTTNNSAGAASLTWAGLQTTNLCAQSDQSGWFVMSAVPTSAGARPAGTTPPALSAALAVLLLAALQY